MKTYKLLTLVNLFCLALAFTACTNSNSENPDKIIETTTNDTTPKSSRDSIAKGTTVTPSPSAIPAN